MITLCERRVKHTLTALISIWLLVQVVNAAGTETAAAADPVPAALPLRNLRLPNDTYPLSYQIHITSNIHLGERQFDGNAIIDIEIRRGTNEIVLHAKELTILEITVREQESNELVSDLTHTYDPHGSFLIIHPLENYQAFEAGQHYRVQILFKGQMQKNTIGIYTMVYEEQPDNRTVYVAATQSEPTYARLVFPCYDEPAFKSNFTIKLTHSSNYTAVSNMPVQELHENGHYTMTTFYPTPPMSTYLVAFVISDFEYISETHRGVTQRVYTSPNAPDKGSSALKNAVRTLAAFEDYFGISYAMKKLDHIALKKNYGAAMENWGLITYKEDNLIDTHSSDYHKKQKDTLTMGHEMAHQWFGNLVSPEWWTYAWMNEGFATYFSYVITDMLHPDYKVMEFFFIDVSVRAYSYNSIAKRPMTFYVERESKIMEVFDIISYQRAACVIKMFHHAFHQKTFVRGISRFLQKFQYSVANELQLFDALQESLLEDQRFQQQPWVHAVRDIMLSWTHSEWIPIVTVTRNYENGTVTFSQSSKHSKSEHWWIPLNFATTQSPNFQHTHVDYFMPPVPQITLSLEELGLQLDGRDWLIVNKQQTGFYHVLYDNDNLRAIARQLQQNHTVIHPANRASIFQDITPLMEHNEFESVEVLLELLKYLKYEENLTPWNLVADTLEFLLVNLHGTASEALYKNFLRDLVSPIFKRTFDNTNAMNNSNLEAFTGDKILELACMADLQDCVEYTRDVAHSYFIKRHNLFGSMDYYGLSDTVLCLGVRYLNDEEFNAMLNLLQTLDRTSAVYDDVLYSLRCTQNRDHIKQYLNELLGENSTHLIMTDNESMMYLSYMYKSNLVARPVVLEFIERNYKLLLRSPSFVEQFNRMAEYMLEQNKIYFVNLRQSIARQLQSEKLTAAEPPLIDIDSKRVGKKMRTSEQFLEKFEQHIHKWLLNEQPADTIYAASLSIRNGSSRPAGLLHAAGQFFRKALEVQL